jgi:hypothetical protein
MCNEATLIYDSITRAICHYVKLTIPNLCMCRLESEINLRCLNTAFINVILGNKFFVAEQSSE